MDARWSSSSSLKPTPLEDFQLHLQKIHPSSYSDPKPQSWSCPFLPAEPHTQLRSKPPHPLHWPLIRVTATDSKLILFLPLAPSACAPVKMSIHAEHSSAGNFQWLPDVPAELSHLPTHWLNEATEWSSKRVAQWNTESWEVISRDFRLWCFGVVCNATI